MTKRNVIWIASYPKSGNTWVHSVLRLAGKNYGFAQKDLDVYNLVRSGTPPEVCPAVNEKYASNPCVVLKTHAAYIRNAPLHQFTDMELVNTAYVHVYRNPLDVLLSYLNFSRIEYKGLARNEAYKKNLFVKMLGFDKPYEYEDWLETTIDSIPQRNLDHALDCFSEGEMSIDSLAPMAGSWIENNESWLSAKDDIPGYSVRYEDLLEDPEHFVKLAELFVYTREDVLTALERVNKRAKSLSVTGDRDQAVFYNKMSSYYFSKYFSQAAVERFLGRHEATLKRFGYEAILEAV